MGKYKLGESVLIIEDCRPNGNATGQVGVYEGRHIEDGYGSPRIRLPDGSAIYGCECWWTPMSEARPLEQMQAGLEQYKAHLREKIFGIGSGG
jgi:hypothetical protein